MGCLCRKIDKANTEENVDLEREHHEIPDLKLDNIIESDCDNKNNKLKEKEPPIKKQSSIISVICY